MVADTEDVSSGRGRYRAVGGPGGLWQGGGVAEVTGLCRDPCARAAVKLEGGEKT